MRTRIVALLAALTAPLGAQTAVSGADSAAVAVALADQLRGESASSSLRAPFNLVGTGVSTPAGSWLGRVRAALLTRDSGSLIDSPKYETVRVAVGSVGFAGDSATVPVTVSGCRANSSVAHYATQMSFTFRRTGDRWVYARPDRMRAIAGDSVRCPW